MKPIKVTEGITITKTRINSQNCIACGKPIGSHSVALSLNNYNDGLSLKKNVWLHIGCIEKFYKQLKKGVNENKSNILVESI